MVAPAAALLLAALSALPCRGTDADGGTHTISNATRNTASPDVHAQPTVTKLYQMLHNTQLHNQSFNSNPSVNTYNFSPTFTSLDNNKIITSGEEETNQNIITSEEEENKNDQKCCSVLTKSDAKDKDKQSLSPNGAKDNFSVINKGIDSVDFNGNRTRRVVKVIWADNVTLSASDSGEVGKAAAVTLRPQRAMDRRRKPGEAGSSAPLLNYIFDSYSNTHSHGSARPGSGNSIYAAAAPEVEALVGSTAHLDCKVDALHDKLVSWVRRKNDDDPMDLLTTGTQAYTADSRYSASFIAPDIWRLEIREVRPSDAAHYDCQLSAHPPRTARVTLTVPEVSVRIVDGAGAEVSEQVCELGSTVALRCEVRGLKMEGGPSLLWYRRDALLNDDVTRGGISVRTEFGANGANSVLRVARVRADDAGSYSCAVARPGPPLLPPAYVTLHIIKGESLAELHQGGTAAVIVAGWINIVLAYVIVHA